MFEIQEFRRPEYEVKSHVSEGPHLLGTSHSDSQGAVFRRHSMQADVGEADRNQRRIDHRRTTISHSGHGCRGGDDMRLIKDGLENVQEGHDERVRRTSGQYSLQESQSTQCIALQSRSHRPRCQPSVMDNSIKFCDAPSSILRRN